MSARRIITPTNIMFIIGGIYFAAMAGLGQGSVYSLFGTLLCFVAVGLDFRKSLVVSSPWRVASAVFVMAMLASQVIASAYSVQIATLFVAGSIVLNAVLFGLFAGVLLSTARSLVSAEEEEEEEEAEPKKVSAPA